MKLLGVKVREVDLSLELEKGPIKGSASTTVGGWGVDSNEGFAEMSRRCDKNADSFFQSVGNRIEQSEVISIGALPFTSRGIIKYVQHLYDKHQSKLELDWSSH